MADVLRLPTSGKFAASVSAGHMDILPVSSFMNDEKRRNERVGSPMQGTLRLSTGERKVKIRNLSSHGAMADGIDNISVGQFVWIKIRGLGWIEARVAWAIAPRCGLEFQSPIA